MHKLTKRLSILLMAVTMCTTGCGQKEENDNKRPEKDIVTEIEKEDENSEASLDDVLDVLEKIEDLKNEQEEAKKDVEEKVEEKVIEKTTITLYDGTELEVTNEFAYTAIEISDNILTEPFSFTEYGYNIYPNTPIKYIKDVIYRENDDGTYNIIGVDGIKFKVINSKTGETTIDNKDSEDIFITGMYSTSYPNELEGIDEDFFNGIEETLGKPKYAVANYPTIGMCEVHYIWMNSDDSLLVYSSTYSLEDNKQTHFTTYCTTVRGLNADMRNAIGLELSDSKTDYVVMKTRPQTLSKYVNVIDVNGVTNIVKESYMSDEALNILKEKYFSDLPVPGTTFKEYAPDNTAKGTYEPGEKDYAEPYGNYNKLYFSNKTNEKCTPNNLTVDAALKNLENPGIGTPDLLISDMLEIYGQPNAIQGYNFVYITKDFYIEFERESSSNAFTNRKDYFDTIVKIKVYYRDSLYLNDISLERLELFDSMN